MKLRLLLPLLVLLSCTALESPRDRARKAVERRVEAGVVVELEGGERLVVERVEVLAMDAYRDERGGLEGFAQLAIEGKVGEIPISYLGNERIAFRCGSSSCSVDGPLARRLEGVAAALSARRRALAREDGPALSALDAEGRPFAHDEVRTAAARPVSAWYVRVESGSAIVGEADPEGRQRRLRLVEREGGWRFEAGLP
ncbi:MAG TPA: hypothetical protein VKY51_05125 [Fredinandcohnia sp.]|nr:hypothetical protein [Fredinandcohnia sp.]